MTVNNEIMLITYPDSLGDNLGDLGHILRNYFSEAIGAVHILPFFPSSADRGFAPITYKQVDSRFGDWQDLRQLARDFDLMYDFMINHLSRKSRYFQDFMQNKDQSKYADFFIRYRDFWPGGEPTSEQIDQIYKRKPRAPYIEVEFPDGSAEKIWCTFSEEQIDLNLHSQKTRKFIRESLEYLAQRGPSLIRLDAFAYATKRPGTSCFFVEPEVWELLEFVESVLKPYDVEILPEIHEHYSYQLKLAEKGYWVYDFALPLIMLYSIYSGTNRRLINWLRQCPDKQFTTLDTHDGIGVVDARDLLAPEEIEETKQYLYDKGSSVKRVYNSTEYGNLDVYQINCTYYSALGNNDQAYLLARAVQFFAPGIPQVYYVGMLAGENDIELVEETKVGRNINRHYYTKEEIRTNLKRPVVRKLRRLMEFYNSYPAFNGDYKIHEAKTSRDLKISWFKGDYRAELQANLQTNQFTISFFDPEQDTEITLFD